MQGREEVGVRGMQNRQRIFYVIYERSPRSLKLNLIIFKFQTISNFKLDKLTKTDCRISP